LISNEPDEHWAEKNVHSFVGGNMLPCAPLLCSYDIPFNFGFTLVGPFIERYPRYFHVYFTKTSSILQISHYLRVVDLLIVFLFMNCM
jgi:hypothetical protein